MGFVGGVSLCRSIYMSLFVICRLRNLYNLHRCVGCYVGFSCFVYISFASLCRCGLLGVGFLLVVGGLFYSFIDHRCKIIYLRDVWYKCVFLIRNWALLCSCCIIAQQTAT